MLFQAGLISLEALLPYLSPAPEDLATSFKAAAAALSAEAAAMHHVSRDLTGDGEF
jgi:hypothetical protein